MNRNNLKIGIGICIVLAALLYVMYRKKKSEDAEREALLKQYEEETPETNTEQEPTPNEAVAFSTDLLNKIPKLPFMEGKEIQVLDKGIFEISDTEKNLVIVPSTDWQSYMIQNKRYNIDDRPAIIEAIQNFFSHDND